MTGRAKVFRPPETLQKLRQSFKETVMTITPKPEQERVLTEAIQAGLIQSPEDALEIALQELRNRLDAGVPPLTAEEWLEEFNAWTSSHSTTAPLLSDEAVSREFIYRERGL
jgi:hypothetical protein